VEAFVAVPERGRVFSHRRRTRLADLDARGRLRLDAVARFLQDVAIDDVDETGWGMPDHLWYVRSIRVDVLVPFLQDRDVALVTWCSGVAPLAAGRRWSLSGGCGGRIEADSVWIHLGPDGRPARIVNLGAYAEAAGARRVSVRPQLSVPRTDDLRLPWPLRASDVDLHGHINNAVYWEAVEHLLLTEGPDLRRPLRACLDYHEPVDLDDQLQLGVTATSNRLDVVFRTTRVNAVASVVALSA
jgi:acyl-ACP thioesterase